MTKRKAATPVTASELRELLDTKAFRMEQLVADIRGVLESTEKRNHDEDHMHNARELRDVSARYVELLEHLTTGGPR